MFWKRQKTRAAWSGQTAPASDRAPKVSTHFPTKDDPQEKLMKASEELADKLSAYSFATYDASFDAPDTELLQARAKVEAARKLVSRGRLAYALGRCLPEHMKYWSSWIKQDRFDPKIAASEISAERIEETEGSRKIKVETVVFVFNGSKYRFVLRDRGLSTAPDDHFILGDVKLFQDGDLVAEFELQEDLSKEYPHWSYSDVRALKVGSWMKDVLDMAAQFEAADRKFMDDFTDQRTLEAARKINLGSSET